MKHLVRRWPSYKKILEMKPLALFLDFDGTLAPIASTPDQVEFPAETKNILEKLARFSHCKIAIVSGRALNDLRKKVDVKDIIYVGNHGLEIEGPQITFESLIPPKIAATINAVKNEISHHLSSIRGVLLEDKVLTLSIHYRLVDADNETLVKETFARITESYSERGEILITSGKKVFEVRPPIVWNKGHAVSWLLKEYGMVEGRPLMPIYIGDDTTDEDAFVLFKDTGLTILVGEQTSAAQYSLKDTQEVAWFLKQLLEIYSAKMYTGAA